MAKITSKSLLVVGTELVINTTAKTFSLVELGNLIYKDGVTIQALYSKFVQLWTQPEYNGFPFPMYAIDAKSGQFQFGTDGQTFSGWKPANDATRQALRDGGWSEYSSVGVLQRQYVGIVSLGEVNSGAQLYYQRATTDAPTNFTFSDEVNEGVQVFGDATNGNFDKRAFYKAFVREFGKKYKSSTLADTGQVATGAYTVNVLLSNEDDLKIQAADGVVSTDAPYSGIDVTYFGTNQTKTIGAGSYPFTKVINGNSATLEQIYTKVQYLLRQNVDIDVGLGDVTGKTADELCYFVGDTLYTTIGVFIANIQAADLNRIVFVDQNGIQRIYPYSSAGAINSNAVLTANGTGYFIMYFADTVDGDYGTADAITVDDKDGDPIAGVITGAVIPFTFDYDGNVQGGRAAGVDASVVVVAGNNGSAKPVVATGTITRSKGISISLVAEQDRAFL